MTTYRTIAEVRAALYPRMIGLLELDDTELIAWRPQERIEGVA